MLGFRLIGMGDADKLDLGKLVLANHAARVAPGGPRLGAETGRMCREPHRQRVGRPYFLGSDVGQGHFGGRNQPLVIGTEQVIAEFRQLPRSGHSGAVDQVGRQCFLISELGGVGIQHESGKRPF